MKFGSEMDFKIVNEMLNQQLQTWGLCECFAVIV